MKTISIIIPVYNQIKHIRKILKKLVKIVESESVEIILVDDGSTDGSEIICKQLEKRYTYIYYIFQENSGVSAARNSGLKLAKGKYILYLDADDDITSDTIKNIITFFDSIYDEVDLVTYPIETRYRGKVLQPHFRYQYLKEDGVYDLQQYPYIGQTTMNIVVKNKFENNILFDESQTFSEDQKYCCDVLKDKLKMGFCSKGKYIYYRDDNSSSGKLSGSCYIFEQCTNFFENLFDEYEEVPLAFQGLFVNDIAWKLASNILLPYHYEEEEYYNAVERIKKLLRKCSNDVILQHPQIDFFEKFYFLRLKDENSLICFVDRDGFGLINEEKIVLKEQSMEAVITKLSVQEEDIVINGFVKSAFLQFYNEDIILCAIENNGRLIKKLELSDSTHNYYLSHEKTQQFKAFQYKVKIGDIESVHFEVCLGNFWFPVHYYFMPLVSLSHFKKIYTCHKGKLRITLDKNNKFLFSEEVKDKRDVWLYYDCAGVASDNGLLQFEHDIVQKDGVERYYILTDERQFRVKYRKNYVKFGSRKHKSLLKKCSKIITAYIEEANIIPYPISEYEQYSKEFDFEVIYLQHGVLHIIMPWKYSKERMLADKIVVSTEDEADLYMQNGYSETELIKTGMPRFERIERKNSNMRKILFAPSWRQYLVGRYENHGWVLAEAKFLSSTFFKETSAFLESTELSDLLEKYNYTLEIKLHPIFNMYKKSYSIKSNRISFVEESVKESDYTIFITDFSSYSYNFEYLNIPVLHFIPDNVEFKAGMNGYRELNYPKEFWDEVAIEYTDLVNKIEHVLEGNVIESKTTFYNIDNVTDKIYRRLKRER